MIDLQGRKIEYVRVSITDRCKLRCLYCMPEGGVECLAHQDILTFEEIVRIVRLMTGLGVHAVRLTGGEPMARRGCLDLIGMLHALPGVDRIGMTTNAILLKGRVAEAAHNGLADLNISLDTLDPENYRHITRCGNVNDVLDVLREALDAGLRVKLNAVPIRGLNETQLVELAALAKDLPVDVRFIELMPIGSGADMKAIPTSEVIQKMEEAFGLLQPDGSRHGMGPAVYGKPRDFAGNIGFISAVSHEFCQYCNRVRITPDGLLKLCLNHQSSADLRTLLRNGATDGEITEAMRVAILHKPVHHGSSEKVDDKEGRRMNQIGG